MTDLDMTAEGSNQTGGLDVDLLVNPDPVSWEVSAAGSTVSLGSVHIDIDLDDRSFLNPPEDLFQVPDPVIIAILEPTTLTWTFVAVDPEDDLDTPGRYRNRPVAVGVTEKEARDAWRRQRRHIILVIRQRIRDLPGGRRTKREWRRLVRYALDRGAAVIDLGIPERDSAEDRIKDALRDKIRDMR